MSVSPTPIPMGSSTQTEAVLCCHPDTPCPVVADIKAAISWDPHRHLRVVYTLTGTVNRLRIPPPRPSRNVNGLWHHTCVELFVRAQNDAEYYEFNFSPSGEWAAYGFRDYRAAASIDTDELEPKIAVRQGVETLELSAVLCADRLPGIAPKIRLSLGLGAVIEDLKGSFSYWALKHPAGKPDFHHADSFALEIVVPG
jgi:hypothetical protein